MAHNQRHGIAVVGMACRLPGSEDVESYWNGLLEGREGIRPVSDAELTAAGVAPSLVSHPRYRKFAATIAGIDLFDAGTFGFSRAEAAAASPQHRLFLESCWQAFEDAGYTPEAAEALGPVGLWAGESPSAYSRHGLFALTERGIDVEYLQHLIGGDRDYLASAVSYRLGLTGPSMAIQTACSSSLVAVMAACDALRSGACAMALAGGVTIRLPQAAGYLYQDGGIFSGDGRCRPFDSAATGTVFGSGVGVVLLRRLEDAIADGDAIHAVIRGGAVNNDGAVKAGFTAPSAEGQRRVIAAALKAARVGPDSIGYVEAHGTATPIGDPIELEALTAAFGLPPGVQCAIGAVKSNIGHLEVAAGVAGLIKVCCAVRDGRIPPTLHFEQANAEIGFERTPFFVPAVASAWPSTDGPRRAGVSSFGIGGTNAHVVVEEPPPRARRRAVAGPQTCVLSAPTEVALRASAGALARSLRARPDLGLADVCFTLSTGRRRFASRLAMEAASVSDLAHALETVAGGGPISTRDEPSTVSNGRRVHLPPTVLDRARHWIEPAKAGYRRFDVTTPVEAKPNDVKPNDELAFDEAEIGIAGGRFVRRLGAGHPWLADHRRDGTAVLAGAAVALLARVAAVRALNVPSVTLADLTWRRALSPVDGTLSVNIEIQRNDGGDATLRLSGPDGVVACEARVQASPPLDALTLDVAALAVRCATSFDVMRLDEDFARRGFVYGPAFRRIVELNVGDGECFARLNAADLPLDRDAGALDAAMQAAFPLLDAGDAAWIPVGIGRCVMHRPDGRAALVHVQRAGNDGDERHTEFDAAIADAAGQVLVRLEGVRLHRAGETTLMRSQWGDAPLLAGATAVPAEGVLFVLDGESDTAAALAPHVPTPLSVIRIEPGIGFEQIGPAHFALDPSEPDDWQQLLTAVSDGPVYVLDRLGGAAATDGEQGLAVTMLSRVLQSDRPGRRLRWLTVHDGAPGGAAVAALGRVIANEQPAHHISALQIDGTFVLHAPAVIVELLSGAAHAVRLSRQGRQTRQWVPLTSSMSHAPPADGLYLISGGLGAFGLDLAEHLLRQAPAARVALLGRSQPTSVTAARIAAHNGALVPVQVDVTDSGALSEAVAELRARFGPVRGVIHAAGVNCDGLVARADGRDFAAVLAPKLRGAVHLDAITRGDPLDWFVLCSSLVGEVGNAGQGAYAYANASLDAFAERRAGPGRTTSILWPYLADGGLMAAPESIAQARHQFGLEPLARAAALAVFDRALGCGTSKVLVANGDVARLTVALGEQIFAPLAVEPDPAVDASLSAGLLAHLRAVVANACGRSFDDIAVETPFDALGVDSLTILAMTERLERDFGTVPKTLFYQFPTIGALAGHLLVRFRAQVAAWSTSRAGTHVAPTAPMVAAQPPSQPSTTFVPLPFPSQRERDIAIIGLAGRFPSADDLDGFWRNLAEGRDLIREIPIERWGGVFAPQVEPGQKGGSYARWGSFLDGIDLFDPLFFRLSPREAALLDPQERLFLETAWHVFEDAAIDPARVKGLPCGVFVGVMWGEYQLYGQATGAGAERPSASYASIANRVSHVMDFTGPSLAIDTMCSSSLVAIHLACEAIRSGDCTMAIAGGVNLAPHPNKWVLLSQGRFAATDGRCRAFGAGGDGYVPGEGVGAVLLKPLGEALADGNRIWGVVRGSAVNHGGRTNAYTVPSPRAQASVIRTALARADVSPDSIGYIEAHGTGTSLGDPIEVAGLVEALGDAGRVGSVALGSVKSNIGHLESAAGIAGVVKVLLQMREGVIVPSLHSDPCNPNIDFGATPFVVPQTATPWRETGDAPRRAGISGFGAGGANAHIVVEAPPAVAVTAEVSGPQVVLLSARTPKALARLVARYVEALDSGSLRLADIAFTTQTGRAALEHRLAVIAGSMDELRDALAAAREGRADARLVHGNTQAGGALRAVLGGDSGVVFVASLFASRDLAKLAQLWAAGHEVDWSVLKSGGRRIALPLYPFERVRCWVDAEAGETGRPLSSPEPTSQAEAEALSRPALLVPVWREVDAAQPSAFEGRVAVVGDGTFAELADAMGAELVAPAVADGLIGRLDRFGAIVDAGLDVALETRHELWRALAARRNGPRLLAVRPKGPDGAFGGGIAAALSGEYAALWSRELQFSDMRPAELAAAVRAELDCDDGVSRVLWRDGVRHRPAFEVVVQPSRLAIELVAVGDGPVLITGGLGGLGLALARHLIGRGVKVLALTGLRLLQAGDTRSQAVEALRARGATVEVYTGDLRDEAFDRFVAEVRERHGPVRGAVHAAGRVGEGARAYQSRSFAQVRSVMNPKGDGLHAVRRALGDDPLAFLVSYSSIAASILSLAGGLVDYAAANAVLEAEAQAAFAQGRRHERAIAWGNWTESGLGLASSERLTALGLAGLSDAEGVVLFEQALAVDAPVLLATGLRPGTRTDAWSLSRGATTARPSISQPAATDRTTAMLAWLSGVFGRELKLPDSELDAERRFEDYGIDSILLADLVLALESDLSVKLEPGLLIEHRTLSRLAAHLATLHTAPGSAGEAATPLSVPEVVARSPTKPTINASLSMDRRIAVIGLACDFPGAPDAKQFWSNLSAGVDSVTEVPADRWDTGRFYDPAGGPGRSVSKWGGFIDGIALFDPAYFGIASEDASSLDPLVRKALEVAVQTLRDAGYADADVKGSRTGVFVGARMSDYGARATTRRKRAVTGSAQNFIAAQLAHCLDLHGPNLVVDTACSSSLTAVHLAVRSLIDGDSELALAGGVDLLLDETPYLGLTSGQALSPIGRCRTFDERADGFVPGEGAGMVLLKRLDRALADGDRVLAVIEGSAVNNDGRTMGLTTPNPEAQEAVIRQALATANADPQTVSYVEAHGTATMIGDPIELKALWRALGDDGARGRCAVGAVKSSIGHLLSAAGIASLIKVVLMLRHRTLAPTLHCASPNPRFAFDRSPLRPVRQAEPWHGVEGVRRAGISSFGFGGTNVHVVASDHGEPSAEVTVRQPLPPQAFNRQRYWIERRPSRERPDDVHAPATAPARVLALYESIVEAAE